MELDDDDVSSAKVELLELLEVKLAAVLDELEESDLELLLEVKLAAVDELLLERLVLDDELDELDRLLDSLDGELCDVVLLLFELDDDDEYDELLVYDCAVELELDDVNEATVLELELDCDDKDELLDVRDTAVELELLL